MSRWTEDAENWGDALNDAGWTFLENSPETSTRLFNSCKASLRAAIIKYDECVRLQKLDIEKEMELFEEAFEGKINLEKYSDGPYVQSSTADKWVGWLAAKENF